MEPFTNIVVEIIRRIPAGRVMSYGGVARNAGNPRAARQVSRILHSCSEKQQLPWHRVINSRGEISLTGPGYDLQRQLLEAEGVVFAGGKVDLKVYEWQGAIH